MKSATRITSTIYNVLCMTPKRMWDMRIAIAPFLLGCIVLKEVDARSWKDIQLIQNLNFDDTAGMEYLQMKQRQYEIQAFSSSSSSSGVVYNINPVVLPTPPPQDVILPTSSPHEVTSSSSSFPSSVPSTTIPTIQASSIPSANPTNSPVTIQPSRIPSVIPSSAPTSIPSSVLTVNPTVVPTFKPTFKPTSVPTSKPTVHVDPFEPAVTPIHPDPWYFNYDNTTFAQYGPGEFGLIQEHGIFHVGIRNNHWGTVTNPPKNYWDEFTNKGWGAWMGIFDENFFTNNQCESGQMQSPIDLRANAGCNASHEVRPLRGDFKLKDNRVKKQIRNNKLRLLYHRRPCPDFNNTLCREPDPPHADFPNGWSGFSDVLHVDVKVPSEHTMEGVRYDAEMQIFHLHKGRKRLPVKSALIRAVPSSTNASEGYNYYFQALLDEFQFEYNKNAFRCGIIRRGGRKLVNQNATSMHHNSTTATRSAERKLWAPFTSIWDPYHPMLIPTIYFYRYDGSLTEPPCTEFVSWFVADAPMIISSIQLEQLKLIIFTNVDTNCQKTSIHHEQSVARSLRQVNDRPISHCTASNFGPDPLTHAV